MAIKLSFRWNCLLKIIAVAISIAIFLPIITQLYNKRGQEESTFHSRKVFVTDIDELSSRATDLKKHLDELDQIKMRALNDLREIEGKRYSIQEEIKKFTSERDKVKTELLQYNKKFAKINKDLEKLKILAAVHEQRKAVPIGIPRSLEQGRIVPIISDKTAGNLSRRIGCQYSTCIDFSKCPITSTFSFYVYKPIKLGSLLSDDSWAAKVYENLVGLPDYKSDGSTSCFFVVIMCLKSRFRFLKKHYHILNSYLKDLHYWQGNGRNHLLLLLFNGKNTFEFQTSKLQHSNGVLATNYLDIDTHKKGFDLLLFSFESLSKTTDLWEVSPPLVPIERKYFFAYYHLGVADIKSSSSLLVQIIRIKGNMSDICITCNCSNLKRTLEGSHCIKTPWESILKNSTFNLLIGSNTDRVAQSHIFHNILESLKTGTIPVLVADNIPLPLDDLIDWQKAMFIFPSARLPEIHYILRSIPEEDIFQFKKHGRFLLETYFVSLSSYLKAILTAIQFKLKLPPSPLGDYHAIPVLRNSDKLTSDTETQFGTLLSSKFNHNWSYTGSNLHKIWNEFPGALYMLPVMPTSQSHPASVQFVSRRSDFMPIGNGEGGDGEVFSKALGGDFPLEHFTVVMLTYDREIILVESIQRLAGLKYLDKVVVVWNNPASPSDELKWPEIGVPVHVVRTGLNSLNNRFLPYDLIDTEAVLSMDDDIYLRHDEIELAFRVWRENRERLVGFPGRFHSWDTNSRGWYYNANYSCELSMVLTGGAFFHKYYSYIYTHMMPKVIRDKVDELMNCEDIAMNFLVSHITGKPPLKVTSRWTFRCPGCPNTLSNYQTHYTERGQCMQFFEHIYGYMPLRRTQFRADSVLFKTRLPPGKSKCYQFV